MSWIDMTWAVMAPRRNSVSFAGRVESVAISGDVVVIDAPVANAGPGEGVGACNGDSVHLSSGRPRGGGQHVQRHHVP